MHNKHWNIFFRHVQNVQNLGWWIFSEQYFWRSFTKEGTGSGQDILEGGFKFLASEARNKLDITDSEDWGAIRERLGSDWEESDWAITGNLWWIKSTVRNEWELFIPWHSVCMSWKYIDLRRKYTRRKQDGLKSLLISPLIGWPISQYWWVVDENKLASVTKNTLLVALASSISSTTHPFW